MPFYKLLTRDTALHPLAVEDVLHYEHKGGRSKADYYSKHLFLRVICHELRDPNDNSPRHYAPGPRVLSPEPMDDPDVKQALLEDSTDGETLQASYSKSKNSTMRRRPILPNTIRDLPSKQGTGKSKLASLLEKEKEVSVFRPRMFPFVQVNHSDKPSRKRIKPPKRC